MSCDVVSSVMVTTAKVEQPLAGVVVHTSQRTRWPLAGMVNWLYVAAQSSCWLTAVVQVKYDVAPRPARRVSTYCLVTAPSGTVGSAFSRTSADGFSTMSPVAFVRMSDAAPFSLSR